MRSDAKRRRSTQLWMRADCKSRFRATELLVRITSERRLLQDNEDSPRKLAECTQGRQRQRGRHHKRLLGIIHNEAIQAPKTRRSPQSIRRFCARGPHGPKLRSRHEETRETRQRRKTEKTVTRNGEGTCCEGEDGTEKTGWRNKENSPPFYSSLSSSPKRPTDASRPSPNPAGDARTQGRRVARRRCPRRTRRRRCYGRRRTGRERHRRGRRAWRRS